MPSELPHILLYALAIWNAATLLVYAWDKRSARRKRRRIPERSLLLMATLFGAAGAWLGMLLWRHKTRHLRFALGVPLMLAAQAALILWLLWRA